MDARSARTIIIWLLCLLCVVLSVVWHQLFALVVAVSVASMWVIPFRLMVLDSMHFEAATAVIVGFEAHPIEGSVIALLEGTPTKLVMERDLAQGLFTTLARDRKSVV